MPLDVSAGVPPALSALSSPLRGGVLALDLSRKTGWAYGRLTDRLPSCGFWSFCHLSLERDRFAALGQVVGDFLEDHEPTDMILEAPLGLGAVHSHQTNEAAMQQQLGMRAIALEQAGIAGCATRSIDARTARTEVIGTLGGLSGDALKKTVVRFWRDRGIKTASHDAADACTLWWWHKQRILGVRPAVLGPAA